MEAWTGQGLCRLQGELGEHHSCQHGTEPGSWCHSRSVSPVLPRTRLVQTLCNRGRLRVGVCSHCLVQILGSVPSNLRSWASCLT